MAHTHAAHRFTAPARWLNSLLLTVLCILALPTQPQPASSVVLNADSGIVHELPGQTASAIHNGLSARLLNSRLATSSSAPLVDNDDNSALILHTLPALTGLLISGHLPAAAGQQVSRHYLVHPARAPPIA